MECATAVSEIAYLVKIPNTKWTTVYTVWYGKEKIAEVSRMGEVRRFYRDGMEVFKHGVPPPKERKQHPQNPINYIILREAFDEKTAQDFYEHPALELLPIGAGTTSYTRAELFTYLLEIKQDDNNGIWTVQT